MTVFTFTLKFDCEKCGGMVAVNGPGRSSTCSSCQTQYSIEPASLGDRICASNRGIGASVADVYRCKGYETREPCCPKCNKHFAFDETLVGQDRQINCPNCDLAIQTFPAPEWLKRELPSVVQLVGADRGGPESSGISLDTNEQAPRPVMLNCPNCAAPLRITAEAERNVVCEHCNVDIYLPDGVWKRLHPVHMVHPWSIVYEGKLETALQRVERHNQEQREESLQREGRRNAERAAAKQKQKRAEEEVRRVARSKLAWISVGIAGVLLVIFAIWSWVVHEDRLYQLSNTYLIVGLVTILSVVVATVFSNRLIKTVEDNGAGWFIFAIWTFVLLSFIPFLGGLIALMRSYSLLVSNKIGEMTTTEEGMRQTYPAVEFTRGEGRPAGVLFVCLAILGQIASVYLFFGSKG